MPRLGGVRSLLLSLNLLSALAAGVLVLAHKGRDGGLGATGGRGRTLVERPLTRALGLAMLVWAATSVAWAA